MRFSEAGFLLLCLSFSFVVVAQQEMKPVLNDTLPRIPPNPLPPPSSLDPDSNKPVKIFLLLGQSNMVGMGEVRSPNSRFGKEFLHPVVSVYPGDYSPEVDYDMEEPIDSLPLESFGGARPTPYPSGGTRVVRGGVKVPVSGTYSFFPGYSNSKNNIMIVNGVEVYRKGPNGPESVVPIELEAGVEVPFKITYLTSAADGLGWISRMLPGTLEDFVAKSPDAFPGLVDSKTGGWSVRNDVMYKGVVSAVAQKQLTAGMWGSTIGPELGFGHVMGWYYDEPVLLIKASQGNRALGWDLLPPGSERVVEDGYVYAAYGETPARWEEGTEPQPINWYAGKEYDTDIEAIRSVLAGFGKLFPQYQAQGYEIAGFAWWQGHRDSTVGVYTSHYEENLVRLIKELRREFEVPDAPFVIGTVGFHGWEMKGNQLGVANAQLAVSGETGNYPEFQGNVKTVEMRDYWRSIEESPKNQDYHYNRNAETYLRVGDALGRGMVEVLENARIEQE